MLNEETLTQLFIMTQTLSAQALNQVWTVQADTPE
ncbi:MAG: hypothetical protein ACJA2Q_002542 [Pseudohongiellaceae bacterium]|jgi:hypothetical protein